MNRTQLLLQTAVDMLVTCVGGCRVIAFADKAVCKQVDICVLFEGGLIIDLISLCLCAEDTEDVDVDERWQQYWHDNGQQLVWNDWLQKYPEYNTSYVDDGHCASVDLMDGETVPRSCQSNVNNDFVGNENEVCGSSIDASDNKNSVIFANGETYSVVSTSEGCSLLGDCENCVETEESAVDSSGNSVNVTYTEDDGMNSLAVDVSKHSLAVEVSNDEVITIDRVEVCDGTDGPSSWDCLWEQHYTETYWYYYDWFMQWLNEEREMLEFDSHAELTADHDVQQSAAQSCDSHDDLLPSSQSTYVATSQELVNIIESLLSELLLDVVNSVGDPCPADGSDRKQRTRKKKQHGRGLFDVFSFHLLTGYLTPVVMITCDI